KPDIIVFTGDLAFDGTSADFDSAWNEVIQPVMDIFSLEKDLIFFCPGNHDIERNNIDKILESGLRTELVSIASVNELIDGLPQKSSDVFSRLTNYRQFLTSKESKYKKDGDYLYSTYTIEEGDKLIGIASFNTAWRAFGGNADYGKLLLGERTIDNAISSLKECHFRIALMHHPFSYLAEFEQPTIQRRILGNFDVLLHGHIHEHDTELVKKQNQDQVLLVAGGTIYSKREYHNGYGILSISLTETNGEIYLREYDDRARRFVPASVYGKDGIVPFKLERRVGASTEQNSIITQLRQVITAKVNVNEFPSISQLSLYPKSLMEIFVEPPLASEPESSYLAREAIREDKTKESKVLRSKQETIKTLNDLLGSGNNILIIGKKEHGKTSLLRNIYRLYLEDLQPERERIPLLINYRNLPMGKNKVYRALEKSLQSIDSKIDLEKQLVNGNCIVLIDDLDIENRKRLEDLAEFSTRYSRNRFIFTI
ncbi:MAG: metallophosphoesterase, partial [Nitrospirota bacterium]